MVDMLQLVTCWRGYMKYITVRDGGILYADNFYCSKQCYVDDWTINALDKDDLGMRLNEEPNPLMWWVNEGLDPFIQTTGFFEESPAT